MALPSFIQEAKKLFAEGKTEACIDLLLAKIEDKKLYYEVLDLKRRVNALESRETRGLINREDATLEHNQISNALLMILQKMDTRPAAQQESFSVPPPPASQASSRTTLFIVLGAIGLGLVGLLIWQLTQGGGGRRPAEAEVQAERPVEELQPGPGEPAATQPQTRPQRESRSPGSSAGEAAADQAKAEEEAFRKARQANTPAAYYEFIKAFPDGRFVQEAKKRLAELERGEEDSEAYQAARRQNTVAAYEAYLKAFPNGAYAAEVQQRLAQLRKEAAQAQASSDGMCKDCARVRSFNVSHQTVNMMVIDVRYYYDGSRGEPAFVSTVMANDGKASSYYAHNPGRVYRGNKVTRCTLKVADSAPATFNSNQIRFSFYGGEDRKTFHQEFKPYKKTWKK